MEKGVWRTISGRKIFIKEGQSLREAMKSSGKFNKKPTIEENQEYIYRKYNDEFDGIYEVRDITDQLNRLYQEGGMEAVDDWFLPGASKQYKDDFKKLLWSKKEK